MFRTRCFMSAITTIAVFTILAPLAFSAPQLTFSQQIALTRGEYATLQVVVAPNDELRKTPFWHNTKTYPLRSVPDDVVVHTGPHADSFGNFPGWRGQNILYPSGTHDYQVMFRSASERYPSEWTFRHHAGKYYHLGWVLRDAKGLIPAHHSFMFFSDPIPIAGLKYIKPFVHTYGKLCRLSIPFDSFTKGPKGTGMSTNQQYLFDAFLEGQRVQLDNQAWKQW